MSEDRLDVAHALSVVLRAALAAEEPVLRAHDLEMWDYAVLNALRDAAVHSQAELAALVRRDQTRLIPILDRLEHRGLLRRTVDPGDRRNRVVDLTARGRDVLAGCKAGIRTAETHLLGSLSPADAATFVAVLDRLAAEMGAHG